MSFPVIDTSSGPVRGFLDRGVRTWRGIPYGRITERFRPPSPATPGDEIDATRWGTASWQIPMVEDKRWRVLPPGCTEGEDCLNLNIWSPGDEEQSGSPRPVLVWLHPGGHRGGAGSTASINTWVYAARHGAVAVTANYRLGPWGWLYLGGLDPEYKDSANLTILDQLMLLRWVRDNIAQFGGDPGNVTVFGASSGATDVATMLGVPSAQGLFHRAAVYSGQSESPIELDEAAAFAERFMSHASPLAATPAELATLPNLALRSIHRKFPKTERPRYGPMIDGVVLPRAPLETVAAGTAEGLSVLVSVTTDEGKMFDVFGPQAVDRWHAGLGGVDPEASHDQKIDFISRTLFIDPAKRLLGAVHRGGGRSWAQVFGYLPQLSSEVGRGVSAGRPAHGADVPIIFIDPEGTEGNDDDRIVGVDYQRILMQIARHGRLDWAESTPSSFPAKWHGEPTYDGSDLTVLPLPR